MKSNGRCLAVDCEISIAYWGVVGCDVVLWCLSVIIVTLCSTFTISPFLTSIITASHRATSLFDLDFR